MLPVPFFKLDHKIQSINKSFCTTLWFGTKLKHQLTNLKNHVILVFFLNIYLSCFCIYKIKYFNYILFTQPCHFKLYAVKNFYALSWSFTSVVTINYGSSKQPCIIIIFPSCFLVITT